MLIDDRIYPVITGPRRFPDVDFHGGKFLPCQIVSGQACQIKQRYYSGGGQKVSHGQISFWVSFCEMCGSGQVPPVQDSCISEMVRMSIYKANINVIIQILVVL